MRLFGWFSNTMLRSVASASPMGSTVPLDLNESLKKIFPGFAGVIHFYGMTEMPNYGTLTFDLSKLGKMMMKDTKIKLVDPDTGTKWFKMIQNAQNYSKLFKLIKNDSNWFKLIQIDSKWY